jgi:hypothetical protein
VRSRVIQERRSVKISELKCRFGCDAPVGIFYLPEGCACFPDRLQALCAQHRYGVTAIDGIETLYDFRIKE